LLATPEATAALTGVSLDRIEAMIRRRLVYTKVLSGSDHVAVDEVIRVAAGQEATG
jgi:hypothetical protein